MSTKTKVYFSLVVLLAIVIQLIVNMAVPAGDDIIEAFGQVDTVAVESSIEGYGYFGHMELSDAKKSTMVTNIAKDLGITDGYNIIFDQGDSYGKCQLYKEGKYANTKIQLISMDTIDDSNQPITEQYILVNINLKNGNEGIKGVRKNLEDMYEAIGVEPRINMCLSGTMEGMLDDEERDEIVKELLEDMDASLVYNYEVDGISSVYGYTKSENQYIYQMGKKVNVNLAITYDENAEKTFIKLATPFINESY